MSVNVSQPKSRFVPLGLLGTLALVAMVECGVASLDAALMPHWLWDWRQTGRRVGSAAPGCEVLCFGDSLCKFGVQPRVLEAEFGIRAYNLGVPCGVAPSSYYLLRRAVEAGARPKFVVFNMNIPMLGFAGLLKRPFEEFLTLPECFDLARQRREPDLFAELMLARGLSSVRQRHEIRAAITRALGGAAVSLQAVVDVHLRNWWRNRGAQVMQLTKKQQLPDGEPDDGPSPPRWSCPRQNDSYVQRFFGLAEKLNATVFLVIPPLSTPGVARIARKDPYNDYAEYVRGLQLRHPNLVVLDACESQYPASAFFDDIHLNRAGATALSREVARWIGRNGAQRTSLSETQPRWIPLARYRQPGPAAELEDMEQSLIAVHQSKMRGRTERR
jgi:hypothetical protein